MILHSDQEGNDCIQKLRCHCIQIMHSDIYSVTFTTTEIISPHYAQVYAFVKGHRPTPSYFLQLFSLKSEKY